jgi:hypothetical protein
MRTFRAMVNFRTSRAIFACCLTWAVASALGCTNLRSTFDEELPATAAKAGLPSPKPDPGTTTLDVAFISIVRKPATEPTSSQELPPAADTEVPPRTSDEELWRWIDETAIAPETRAALRLNGIRVGKVHTMSEFTRSLNAIRREPLDEAAKLLDAAAVGSDLSHKSRRIPCRMGRRYELPVRNPAPGEVPTLVSLDGQTIGRTLSSPQPMFAVTLQPADASGILIRMQPEIQYGGMRQTWVGSDSALRIDNRRESWLLETLAFEMNLAKGSTIVAGSTVPASGLGSQMFTGMTADGEVDHVLMVINVTSIPELLAK